ncbi:unnamed protein product, partial [Mesorhabditis spiculigera]
MKKVIDHMTGAGKPEAEINEFKKKIQAWVVGLLAKDKFKTLSFYVGERQAEGNGEGQVCIVEYRDVDGEEVPTLLLVKQALEEEKC